MINKHALRVSLLAGLLFSCAAAAQTTYKDNFSSSTTNNQWLALNDACLTAGTAAAGTGVIPGCSNIGVSAPTDAAGFGALRLTPAQGNQTGAILSNFTFPLSQGMQVTFTTYTYGGDSQSPAKDGADGISFMLTDGTLSDGTVIAAPTVAGGLGGSLGYSCSNINSTYEGMANAYLGLGIDEYGNFLNSGDNTDTGILNSRASGGTKAYGDNSYSTSGNPYYQPQRIGLRGAGNTTWAWLQSQNPDYYTGSSSASVVQGVCKTGMYVARVAQYKANGDFKKWVNVSNTPIPYNYKAIPGGYQVLPTGTLIANEGTSTRAGNPSSPADYTKNAWPITYKLTLSPGGLLNFSYSYNNGAFQPVLVNNQITTSNGPLPASFRFGFSAGTGGSDNVHEITCFQAAPLQSNSSAGANTVQSGQYRTGTQIYLASYSSDNWFGSLVSAPLVVATDGTLGVGATDNWDAKCVLTGGACAAMASTDATTGVTTTPNVTVQGPTARTLLTADSSSGAGLPFQWASLNSSEQAALNTNSTSGLADAAGQTRLAWLRGDRTTEQLASPTPGTLRARSAVLGDIIDSSPTWVGAPTAANLPDAFNDGLYGTGSVPENATGAQTYTTFVTSNVTRENVVYVGSNDGFLHGFDAGANDSSGNYVATNNTGKELLGFMPSSLLLSHASDLTNSLYAHDYFVDATPAVGDLFYNGVWHTWLVGGVGTGGSEIYALDVTDPSQFSETKAASLVLGDWTNATLTHLGNTVGAPIIARLHNGQWAIIFGNGIGSGTSAGIYIGLVDSATGTVSFQFLDTGVGDATAANANGIAYVSSSDMDADHITDYLYAGDQQGNVWRFDLTGKTSASWVVSQFGKGTATPLFVAKDGSGNRQPITTAIAVAGVKTGTDNRVMLLFGTGQTKPLTSTSGVSYATGQQSFYGIWDWDMTAWNGKSTVAYAALTGTQTVARAGLLTQVVATTTAGTTGSQVQAYRTISSGNQVCWQGSATCGSGNDEYGWLFDLPSTQEQVVYNPTIIGGAVVVQTAIPPTISALQCNPGLQTGWTMAFDPASGGGFVPQSFFPNSSGSYAPDSTGATVAGIQLNAVGSATTVNYGGQSYLVTQTVNGSAALSKVNPPGGNSPARVAWKEIKN